MRSVILLCKRPDKPLLGYPIATTRRVIYDKSRVKSESLYGKISPATSCLKIALLIEPFYFDGRYSISIMSF